MNKNKCQECEKLKKENGGDSKDWEILCPKCSQKKFKKWMNINIS